jgi:carbonic anhydrase/acetyltransferase-like protein (isoleucine patch superfamily)
MFPGIVVRLEEGAHIGHGAIIHGAHIGRNCLVGMNAVIMDEAELGEESIVGALTFVKAGEKIPRRSLVAGNPGKIIREVSDEMIQWKTQGTQLYQKLPGDCFAFLRPTLPLHEAPANPTFGKSGENYKPWKSNSSE